MTYFSKLIYSISCTNISPLTHNRVAKGVFLYCILGYLTDKYTAIHLHSSTVCLNLSRKFTTKKFCVLLQCKNDGAHFQKQLKLTSNRLLSLVENNKQLERKHTDNITDCIPLLKGSWCWLCKGWGRKKIIKMSGTEWVALIQHDFFKKQTNKTQKNMSLYRRIAWYWILSQNRQLPDTTAWHN